MKESTIILTMEEFAARINAQAEAINYLQGQNLAMHRFLERLERMAWWESMLIAFTGGWAIRWMVKRDVTAMERRRDAVVKKKQELDDAKKTAESHAADSAGPRSDEQRPIGAPADGPGVSC